MSDGDFSHLEAPINALAAILAAREGRAWERKIRITLDAKPDELHCGLLVCRLHPVTVLNAGDLPALIRSLFKLSDTLFNETERRRKAAVSETKALVKDRVAFLRRRMQNGDLDHFLLELVDEYGHPSSNGKGDK